LHRGEAEAVGVQAPVRALLRLVAFKQLEQLPLKRFGRSEAEAQFAVAQKASG
jgi:hypothetical protein